jgi:hypothetical protein
VRPRNDENVDGGLRVDVTKRHEPLVLVDERRRDLARGDLAEEAG